jgi:hypothetical protein
MMLSLGLRLFCALTAAASAVPAEACRVFLEPSERLAMGHERKIFSAVTLVRIVRAGYTSKAFSDAHPWRASAKVEQVLLGSYTTKEVQFERGFGSSACDDGRPVPKARELWVVYFWSPPDNSKVVWISYPANVAFGADPRIKRFAR